MKINNRITKFRIVGLLIIFLMVSFGILMMTGGAFAQDDIVKLKKDCEASDGIWLQVAIPIKGKTVNCIRGFPQYVEALYNLFIGIIGILAVIMIMAGGFQWLLAAGNAQRISGAKTTIISSVLGLVLALTSYTILNLINPDLTKLNLRNIDEVSGFDWSIANFCKANVVLSDVNSDKLLSCGKQYKYKGGNTEAWCAGYKCCDELPCNQTCVYSGTVNYSYNCAESLPIEDKQNFGYGTRNWNFAGSIALLGNKKYCGSIYYHRGPMSVGSGGSIGDYCINNKYCVVKIDDGYQFTMKEADVPWSLNLVVLDKVGSYNTWFCF